MKKTDNEVESPAPSGTPAMAATLILYALVIGGLFFWRPWGRNGERFETWHFYYLALAALIWIFSYRYFGGRFIRPRWKQGGKFFAYMLISLVLLVLVGHYALIFIIGHQALGALGHYLICRRHQIGFWTCQPEEKYRALMENWGKGNFRS